MATQDQITANLIALGFSNSSAEAIYNKIAESVGLTIDNTITEMANSENKISNLLISQYGYLKALYYVSQALAFQYGDNLVQNNAINPDTGAPYLNWIYATVDQTKQIIAQASFQEVVTGNAIQLILKVATTDLSGNLTALSPDQLTAFVNYMQTFEGPGLSLTIISTTGNVLAFDSIATYISAYDLPTLQTNIANALAAFQVQPISSVSSGSQSFDSVLYMDQLGAFVQQSVPGLKDFFTYVTTIDGQPFSGSVALSSGYFTYDASVLTNIIYKPVSS